MKFCDAIKEFIYDQKYFISLFENSMHIFNYTKLIKISEDNIKISIENFYLDIYGKNLYIKELNNKELLIKGMINKIEKIFG